MPCGALFEGTPGGAGCTRLHRGRSLCLLSSVDPSTLGARVRTTRGRQRGQQRNPVHQQRGGNARTSPAAPPFTTSAHTNSTITPRASPLAEIERVHHTARRSRLTTNANPAIPGSPRGNPAPTRRREPGARSRRCPRAQRRRHVIPLTSTTPRPAPRIGNHRQHLI